MHKANSKLMSEAETLAQSSQGPMTQFLSPTLHHPTQIFWYRAHLATTTILPDGQPETFLTSNDVCRRQPAPHCWRCFSQFLWPLMKSHTSPPPFRGFSLNTLLSLPTTALKVLLGMTFGTKLQYLWILNCASIPVPFLRSTSHSGFQGHACWKHFLPSWSPACMPELSQLTAIPILHSVQECCSPTKQDLWNCYENETRKSQTGCVSTHVHPATFETFDNSNNTVC